MDDHNQENATKYQNMDSTLPVGSDFYSDPTDTDSTEKGIDYYSNPYETPIPPPPPKWNIKSARSYRLFTLGICIFLIGCIIGATIFFFAWQKILPVSSHQNSTAQNQSKNLVSSSTSTTTATMISPTPTPNYEYTAMDIVQHLQERDKKMSLKSTNGTIWDWSHDNYFISVHASSSVQWVGCSFASVQQCADTSHFGLWVYPDANDADSAWQQVATDSLTCSNTSSASVSCGQQEAEYLHGRCLLLGDNGQSTYGQIVARYCL